MSKQKAGVLCNQASVDREFRLTFDRLPKNLTCAAIFGPQHGFLGTTQANMIEVDSRSDSSLGVPIYSLYGAHRKPTADMLEGIDVMVVDLQDVGVRGYTYVWTMLLVMEACAETNKRVVIFDRPNPLGGVDIEGPLVKEGYESFVGMHAVPIRHGLTLGELAMMFKEERKLDVELEVKLMDSWQRDQFFPATHLPWVLPSPNLPTFESTVLYPGMELLEGTNISEGRGTTKPFELFGAPYFDANKLCDHFNGLALPGVHFRPASFEPTFDKWQGETCHGAQIHIKDARQVRSVELAVAIMHYAFKHVNDEFAFNLPPYEYETKKMPIDILYGSSELREGLPRGVWWQDLVESWVESIEEFRERRHRFLLYS